MTLPSALSSSRWWAVAACFFILLANTLLGIHPPFEWVKSHYVFDYHAGFVGRSLVGQSLIWLGFERVNNVTVLTAALVLLLASWAAMGWRMIQAPSTQAVFLATIVFAISLAPRDYAWQIGFFETGFMAVGMLAWSCGTSWGGIIARCCLAGIGFCIHEAFLLMAFPMTVYELLLALRRHNASYARLKWLIYVIFGLCFATYFMTFGRFPIELWEQGHAYIQSRAIDFNVPKYASIVLFKGADSMWQHRFVEEGWFPWSEVMYGGIVALPTIVFLTLLAKNAIPRDKRSKTPFPAAFVTLVAISTCIVPIFMNLLAWDYIRYFASAIFSSYFCILIGLRHGGSLSTPSAQKLLAAPVVALMLAWGTLAHPPGRVGSYGAFPENIIKFAQSGLEYYYQWK